MSADNMYEFDGGGGLGLSFGGDFGYSSNIDSLVDTFMNDGIGGAISYSLSLPGIGDGLGLQAGIGDGLNLYDPSSGGGLGLQADVGDGYSLYQEGSGGGLGLDYGNLQGSIGGMLAGGGSASASSGLGAGKTASDLLKSAGSWINENKTLAGLLGSGLLKSLASGGSAEATRAAVLAKEEVDQRSRQRISDSITGMSPISVSRPGLLQTMSGQNVYGQNGRIAR